MRHADPSSVLLVQGLCFAHPGQPPLFTDWHANLPPGVTLLEGDTGSGKSTLLQLLAGQLPAGRGVLCLRGVALHLDAAAYRREVCLFDPRDEAFDDLNPAELRQALAAHWPGVDEARWHRHLRGFGLEVHAGKPMRALSTGSRRKAGLAAALSSHCALTLLDEPASGLDAASLAYLAQALGESAAEGDRAWLLASSAPLRVAAAHTITLQALA